MSDPWKLKIPNCRWNVSAPFTAVVTLTPAEKALIDKGLLDRSDLVVTYRESIERMDYQSFSFIGSAPAEVAESGCR